MKPAYIFQMISDEHERDGIAVLFNRVEGNFQ